MCNAEIIATTCALKGIEEEVHTYKRWNDMGFQVKRGSKALFSCMIWKYVHTVDVDSEDETAKMFMHKASFFGRSQVEPINRNNKR